MVANPAVLCTLPRVCCGERNFKMKNAFCEVEKERLLAFMKADDFEFLLNYFGDISVEEMRCFLEENPRFMKEHIVEEEFLLQGKDELYEKIKKEIKNPDILN